MSWFFFLPSDALEIWRRHGQHAAVGQWSSRGFDDASVQRAFFSFGRPRLRVLNLHFTH